MGAMTSKRNSNAREKILRELGWDVLRFSDEDVEHDAASRWPSDRKASSIGVLVSETQWWWLRNESPTSNLKAVIETERPLPEASFLGFDPPGGG